MSKWVGKVKVPLSPAVPENFVYWSDAFRRLSNGRQVGMAANRLLMIDVGDYFDRLGWQCCDDYELFLDVMQVMDSIYLDWVKENSDG
jgi:hypothetical protein